MSNGQIALAISSAVFALAAAFHFRSWRRPPGSPPSASAFSLVPTPPPAPADPARHPVLVAADWLKAEREARAADAYVAELTAAGLPTALDGLRGVFAPKAEAAPAPK